MATFFFESGLNALLGNSVSLGTDPFRIALAGTLSGGIDPSKAADDLSVFAGGGFAAAWELSIGGYVGGFAGAGRKTLAGVTVQRVASNRIRIDATDPSAWTLAAGANVLATLIFIQLAAAADDSDCFPLAWLDHADVATNGGNFSVLFHADGIGYIQV